MNPLLFAAAVLGPAAVAELSAMEPWGPRPPLPRPPLPRTPPPSASFVARARAEAKRRRRQRERRRVALGGLPMWEVGTPGEEDCLLIAARTWRQARQYHADMHGLHLDETYDLQVIRADWLLAVELEPVVTEPGVWWGQGLDARETLPDGEPVWRGYGVHYDDDSTCEECGERVSSCVDYETADVVMAVCRACLAQLGPDGGGS